MNYVFNGFLGLVVLGTLIGCASIFGPRRAIPPEPGFRQGMAPAQNANPLPVEIAQDIAHIIEKGAVPGGPHGAWNPATLEPPSERNHQEPTAAAESAEVSQSPTLPPGPLVSQAQKRGAGPLGFKKPPRRQASLVGPKAEGGGQTVTYIVRYGDTLMEIAFETYGDYLRWREIYRVNRHKMEHYTKMKVGTELTLHNVKYVYIRKVGQPYLIRKGDTLKSIAEKIYGTSERWADLWKNNPQLIRNPKKIYAGFTLYYHAASQPDEASEMPRKPSQATGSESTH